MTKAVALNEHIYNLLIKKDLDHFTVTGLRDALVKTTEQFADGNEARKFIYRQISRLVGKSLLKKQTGEGRRGTIYYKSELFKQSRFIVKSRKALKQRKTTGQIQAQASLQNDFLDTLQREKAELQALQEIALREMDKYQEILNRFPDEASYVQTLFLQARERSKNIQGDLEALTKLLVNYPSAKEDNEC